MSKSMRDAALKYHAFPVPGKIEVTSTKPCLTQWDLSLAYTPGVAVPCLEIEKDPALAYKYTSRANLVAVVSNGTAVLGLGNIGALAGKPVMEGKGVLFKRFADIDVFDLEVNTENPDEIIKVCKLLEPTFGGINLEDIKAPECFYIEETLKKEMDIPVFHDDQHGTAIISGAGLLNALELAGKDISKVRLVVSGAGAAAIACANLYIRLGVKRENITLVDSKGVVTKERAEGMNPYKAAFAVSGSGPKDLAGAMKDADVFLGLSVKDLVSPKMIQSMAAKPIVFAMANPDPEITYPDAKNARPDIIMATGRSDYPNQVNNVLGFPFVFRGALDCYARSINEEMKVAACHALANLAKEDVPEQVCRAYQSRTFQFGPDYIIPTPFDYRVLLWEASAVAKAAMETGVAQKQLDLDEYKYKLERKLGRRWQVMQKVVVKAKRDPRRIVYPEGTNPTIIRAAHQMLEEGMVKPVLIGSRRMITDTARELGITEDRWEIVDPRKDMRKSQYAKAYLKARQRKGMSTAGADRQMLNPIIFGTMMVQEGDADGIVVGISGNLESTLCPALEIIPLRTGVKKVAGVQLVMTKDRVAFFADTVMTVDPTAEELADIALLAASVAKEFNEEPIVAMLSFSNFGNSRHPTTEKVRRAVEILNERNPNLIVDGEIQADLALMPDKLERLYPFSRLVGSQPNVFVFPDLNSANISYKLIHSLTGAETVGPIIVGPSKPLQMLQPQSETQDILHMTTVAVAEAQEVNKHT
ncbi:MAG: NADP-dependent malic enzyme [Candidatus Eisenbacteria bacterium]|uniref:NADP-dependent malic enzyme n=1 Tax=Eiseniibacteriota bacterium TaxID=2212470 RepID=A0A948S0W2_UNCEI|nr:NADP-dependent malic enzyme [Candidatus Eisenbacteria bacterium]MBU2693149.1 NADP-dependent malic enzyme [Candidatus Eisenbacteria bacterium]